MKDSKSSLNELFNLSSAPPTQAVIDERTSQANAELKRVGNRFRRAGYFWPFPIIMWSVFIVASLMGIGLAAGLSLLFSAVLITAVGINLSTTPLKRLKELMRFIGEVDVAQDEDLKRLATLLEGRPLTEGEACMAIDYFTANAARA